MITLPTPLKLLIAAFSFPSFAQAAEIPLGQIIIDPDHPQWLMRHGGEHFFICGPGDPEGFLYLGERQPDGTRKGPQDSMIRKLVRFGGNCIYMQAVRTHGGDADMEDGKYTENPFVDSDPSKGIDEDILDQWEEWFTHMDRNGIVIYLFLYDDGAKIWDTGDEVGAEEKAFVTQLVTRFRHHKNLIWNIGEESEEAYSTNRVQNLATLIKNLDHPGRVIGNHHLPSTTLKNFVPGGDLNHYAMQLTAKGDEAHAGAIEAFRKAAGRYQVIFAETTAVSDDPVEMRRHIWDVAMGGLMPMLYGMDIVNTPDTLLNQCRILQSFFEDLPFHLMSSHDELAGQQTKYVFARPGLSYVAYANNRNGPMGIKDLEPGDYQITWVNCITGGRASDSLSLEVRGDRSFAPPDFIGSECALSLLRTDVDTYKARMPLSATAGSSPASSSDHAPLIKDIHVVAEPGEPTFIQLSFTDDGPGPYSYEIVEQPKHGSLSGVNNDRYYTPQAGFTGEDQFSWRVHDGLQHSTTATVRIRVDE